MAASYITELLTLLDKNSGTPNTDAPYINLYDILHGSNSTSKELAQRMDWPLSTVTIMLGRLAKFGLVRSYRSGGIGGLMTVYECIRAAAIDKSRVEMAISLLKTRQDMLMISAAFDEKYLHG